MTFDDAGKEIVNEKELCVCGHELTQHRDKFPFACLEQDCEFKCLRFRAAEPALEIDRVPQ